jgi:hypothetical protein
MGGLILGDKDRLLVDEHSQLPGVVLNVLFMIFPFGDLPVAYLNPGLSSISTSSF